MRCHDTVNNYLVQAMWGHVDTHGGSSSTHIPNFKMHEGWSCIQRKPGWKCPTKILVLLKQVSLSSDEMNHPFGGYSPDSKFTVYDKLMFSLYIYTMRVKAKILVGGVRRMNCNEIPDIWQMAVRRFSRVQSMPSCLYKLYWAHWTKDSHDELRLHSIIQLEDTLLSNK